MNMQIIKDAIALGMLPVDVLERLKNNQCPMCGAEIKMTDFRDSLSLKEFTISGMCQVCQDEIFKDN
jgi:hypothetical protein